MEQNHTIQEAQKKFSIEKRAKGFRYALRGLRVFIWSTHNMWIHIVVAIVVIGLGFIYQLNESEWGLIVFAIGMVMTAEAFNTAIEKDIDLTSPGYHDLARDTKDVAAGAVLIATLTAIAIGLIIFLPKIV